MYIVEADELDQVSKAYKNPTLPIDVEHRTILQEVLGERIPVEPSYDVSVK